MRITGVRAPSRLDKEPLWALQKLTKKDIDQLTKKKVKKKGGDEDEKDFLLCKFCKNKITSAKNGISVNGKHKHTFKNPKGIVFDIGCFSTARGCVNYGASTMEYTWFPGFAWCFSLCANCFMHLGWCYRGTGERFYGLITDHLIEAK